MYFKKGNKYIILDIEGNSAKYEEQRRITQFSALLIEDEKITEINMYNRNVNYIPPYVKKLTNLSVKKLKTRGLTERHLVNEIHDLLSSVNTVYAYGCDFDKNIIKLMFKKHKLEPVKVKWTDVILDVEKYLQPSKTKLSVAAFEYGFENENYHNALVDCYATLHLMKVIMEKKEEEKQNG